MGKLDKLNEALEEFDEEINPITERDVVNSIKDLDFESNQEWRAEMMAFQFDEGTDHQNGYFKPQIEATNESGDKVKIPDRQNVTSEIVEHWKKRTEEVEHPVLKARYADLVWDIGSDVMDKGFPDMARLAIKSLIEIAEKDCYTYETQVIDKLKRALSLALMLNDEQLTEKTKETMISYEDEIAKNDEPGTWGFSFEELTENDNIDLENSREEKIISDLESRLDDLTPPFEKEGGFNLGAQKAAMLLASYYESLGKQEDLERVLGKLVDLFEHAKDEGDPLNASMWGEDIHSLLHQYGLSDQAKQIAGEIKELNKKGADRFKEISHEMEITDEEMEEFLDGLMDENMEDSLINIANHFIPSKDRVTKQVKNLSETAPATFLFSKKLQDSQGRHVATLGPVNEDLRGRIMDQMSQNISISGVFLHNALQRVKEEFKLSASKLTKFLYRSPVFREEKEEVIKKGLDSYLEEDYLTTIHVLIPQIEASLRELVELTGEHPYYPNQYGGFNINTLGSLLESSQGIRKVFGERGDDMILYLKMLLTDPRGLNLRNRISHSLGNPSNLSNYIVADRLVHVLLSLALVEEKEKQGTP